MRGSAAGQRAGSTQQLGLARDCVEFYVKVSPIKLIHIVVKNIVFLIILEVRYKDIKKTTNATAFEP